MTLVTQAAGCQRSQFRNLNPRTRPCVACLRFTAILLLCLLPRFGSADEWSLRPADSAASANATQLLAELQQAAIDPSHKVWAGQNMGHSNRSLVAGYRRNVERLVQQTGRFPQVLGLDYGYDRVGVGYPEANQLLVDHWNRHGIVSISMHPRNPWRWSNVHDTTVGSVDVLLRKGTAANRRWTGTLDHVAKGISRLQDEDVVVLWRPLHEMNGTWFWWSGASRGKRVTPKEYRRIWRHMFHYFRDTHQLHNLLWVYAPSAVYGKPQRPVNDYYPGDCFVDVVGLDYYGDPASEVLRRGLDELSQLGNPVVIAEFGFNHEPSTVEDNRRLIHAVSHLAVKPVYVMYWHSWANRPVAIVDHRNAAELVPAAAARGTRSDDLPVPTP